MLLINSENYENDDLYDQMCDSFRFTHQQNTSALDGVGDGSKDHYQGTLDPICNHGCSIVSPGDNEYSYILNIEGDGYCVENEQPYTFNLNDEQIYQYSFIVIS